MSLVPVSCPSCGFEGFVRIERMNRAFVCKKCSAKFYIDQTGSRVLGAPPGPTQPLGRFDPPRRLSPRAEAAGRRAQAAHKVWRRVPRPLQIAIIALPLVLLTAFFGLRWSGGPPADLPESLVDRARFVGEAFVRNDTDDVKSLAASGTSGKAGKWLYERRPLTWPDSAPKESSPSVTTNILFQNIKNKESCVIITVKQPSDPDEEASGPGQIDLVTYWALDSNGQWFLDGGRTLDARRNKGS